MVPTLQAGAPGQGRESCPAVESCWDTWGHSHVLQPRCTLPPSVSLGGAALSNNTVRRAASPRATAGPAHRRARTLLGAAEAAFSSVFSE